MTELTQTPSDASVYRAKRPVPPKNTPTANRLSLGEVGGPGYEEKITYYRR